MRQWVLLDMMLARRTEEDDFQAQVIDLARMLGYLVYHSRDSRRSEPGFPDLVIVGRGRVIFAELKSEKGRIATRQRVSASGRAMPSQADWLNEIRRANTEVYVWRPSQLQEIADVLQFSAESGKATCALLAEPTFLGRVR